MKNTWLAQLVCLCLFALPAFAHHHEGAITQMYEVGLGREPEPEGLEYWDNIYETQGVDAVVVGIFSSPEYFAHHESNYYGFVTGLYGDLLQRPPDHGGFDAWVEALSKGQVNLTQAVQGFVSSPEYRSHPRW